MYIMTKRLSGLALLSSAGLLLLGGCNQNSKNREALLHEEASTLRTELDTARSSNRQLAQENDQLKMRNVQLAADLGAKPLAPATAITLGGFSASERNGEIVVQLPSDILFDAGRDSIKTSAKSSLNQLATEIKQTYPTSQLRLEGFTDTDPIKKSKDRYETNYHLGFERAFSVGEYLQGKGIPAKNISFATFGPHKPKGSKSASRRVELVVVVE